MREQSRAGRVLAGRFALIDIVGSGGFGTVWKARDHVLAVDVALKEVFLASAVSASERTELLQRARHEARNAARLRNHPNIVGVHDLVLDGDIPWMVMQFVHGRSLREHVETAGPLDIDAVAAVAAAVLAALEAAHAHGIVHRDVKPGNILLADDGAILLTDFGIAVHPSDTALTATGRWIGSPGYAAPERLHGIEAPSGDLFSLGATLYYALQASPPGGRCTPSNAGRLTPLIQRLLEPDPAYRPTIAQARAWLDPASAGSTEIAAATARLDSNTRPAATRHGPPALVSAELARITGPVSPRGWSPERPVFSHTAPPAAPTLNSIYDNPGYGDERKFARVRNLTIGSGWLDAIDLTIGHAYEVCLYYHNDSDRAPLNFLNARVEMPHPSIPSSTAAFVYGHLAHTGADIHDVVTFNNRTYGDILLRYEPDSAYLITEQPSVDNIELSGRRLISQVGSGVPLTPRSPDRTIGPGDSGRVVFRLRADGAAFDTSCGVQLAGTGGWSPTLTAHTGDTLVFLASYTNVGSVEQLDIVVKNEWPAGLHYLSGSSKFHADTTPNGGQPTDDGIGAGGINIGTYKPGADGHLTYRATVTATAPATLVNRVYIETGNGWAESSTIVYVQ